MTTSTDARTAVPVEARSAGTLVGTRALLRLALRRDRVLLTAWVVGFALMVAFSVAATVELYATEESRLEASAAINSTAALVALYGKVYVPTSIGALSLIKLTAFGAALVSVVFVFLIVRHTRTEEETGRLELLAAGVVGRAAPLAAALLYGVIGSLALGVLTTIGLLAVGMDTVGSLAFGLSWAMSGMVFSAVAAVAAQVTVSHRAAIGIGLSAVALAYVLRAVGDLAEGDPGWLSWLSPIGWSQQIRPFAGDRWWVAGLSVAAIAALVPLAFWLRSRRDLGSGMLPERPGPAAGGIRGVFGLAWRLQRGALIAWLVGVALMGVVLGSVAQNVSGLLDNEQMRELIAMLGGEQALVDAFLAAEIAIFAIAVGGYAISSVLRLRGEESSGHAELLLSTPTGRVHWAMSHFAFALAASSVVLITGGVSVGVGHGMSTGDLAASLSSLTGAAAAAMPAVWVMAGLTLVLWAWAPRAAQASWGLLVAFIVIGEFGALWELPTWVLDISPFAHLPTLPGGSMDWPAVVVLTVVASGLATVGMARWRQRDLRP